MADKLTNLIRVELCLTRKWTGEFIYLKIENRIKDTKIQIMTLILICSMRNKHTRLVTQFVNEECKQDSDCTSDAGDMESGKNRGDIV